MRVYMCLRVSVCVGVYVLFQVRRLADFAPILGRFGCGGRSGGELSFFVCCVCLCVGVCVCVCVCLRVCACACVMCDISRV